MFLESDLRAHANPTRMAMIRQAAEDLATRYRSPCPRCGAPTREMRARSDLMHADPARCDLCNP
ncbi:MAG TPA: DUF6671 family protein [Steroidobacteraceae bacterium]|nr:DUF6671 family protein [Steroidobacteraceae bacterium]